LSNPGLFQLGANQCTGQTLQPGGQCSFSVSCAPPGVIGSTENNTVLLTWRADLDTGFTGRAYSTLDCGFYISPDTRGLQLEPSQYDFGSISPGEYSVPHGFMVRNSGSSPLTLLNTLGLGNGFELVSSTCTNGLVLASGAECQIQVRFHAEGSPGSTRATILFATFSQGSDGFDRSGSELYATTGFAETDVIFEDGFE
jgi:hypothetical protein